MILPWKRKEVFVGSSLTDFNRTRGVLSENKIEYDFRIVDRNSQFLRWGRSRAAEIGCAGGEPDILYYVYVNTPDYETAEHLLISSGSTGKQVF